MTTPPPAAGPDTEPAADPHPEPASQAGPRVSGADLRNLGGLRRSRTDRKVAGVAGGLGDFLDVDPTIVRVALVVLTLFGGAGVVLYAAAWLLVPEEGSDRGPIDLEPPVRTVVLAVVAAFAVLALLGHAWGFFGFPWPLAVVGLVVLAVLAAQGRLGSRGSATPLRPPYAAGPPPGWVGAPPAVSLTKDDGGLTDTTGWTPPPPYAATEPPPRRRRGPRLFLPTLALIALGWGTLWLVELGGQDLPDSAYAALALAVSGLMLVVGAWFGRTLGVVLLAVLCVAALGISRATDAGLGERVAVSPVAAVAMADGYDMTAGRMTVDLTRIADLEALDGRHLYLDGNVGQITVIVPDDLEVTATATADGGQVDVFGTRDDGNAPSVTRTADGGPDAPRLTIDAELDFGDITVRTS